MARRRTDWLMQIVRIQDKGFKAFEAGIAKSECPYGTGGGGGSVQQQRRRAWYAGWDEARRTKEEQNVSNG